MTEQEEAEMVRRAFDLVRELNEIAQGLRSDYTLELTQDNVRTFQDPHPVFMYNLRVAKNVRPAGASSALAARFAGLGEKS